MAERVGHGQLPRTPFTVTCPILFFGISSRPRSLLKLRAASRQTFNAIFSLPLFVRLLSSFPRSKTHRGTIVLASSFATCADLRSNANIYRDQLRTRATSRASENLSIRPFRCFLYQPHPSGYARFLVPRFYRSYFPHIFSAILMTFEACELNGEKKREKETEEESDD